MFGALLLKAVTLNPGEVICVKEDSFITDKATIQTDVQRAPPEGANMHVALSIWAQTPPGAIQVATCI